MKLEEVWKVSLDHLKLELTSAQFNTLVKPLKLVGGKRSAGRSQLVIECSSIYLKSLIEKRFLTQLEKTVSKVADELVVVVVEVNTKASEDLTKENAPLFAGQAGKEVKREGRLTKTGLEEEMNLENFAVSSTNEMAYAAARAVSKSPGKAYNPLFLYGGVGVGKTHLMQGVGWQLLKGKEELKIIYCSGEDFTNEIIDAIRKKSTARFRGRYRRVDLLMIDDIQFIAGKAAVQEEFFHTFNAIAKEGGQIVLTSDKQPSEIGDLEDRLRSRFEGGLSIDIGQPDFELRSAIVMIKAKNLGVVLPTKVAQFLALNRKDTRALLGALVTLLALSKESGEEIGVELAKKVLRVDERLVRGRKAGLPAKDVLVKVCRFYNLAVKDVVGAKRVQNLTYPRHLAMFLMRHDLGMGLSEIGREFGGRDHTSVMHAVRKIELMIEADEKVVDHVSKLRAEIYAA